MKVSLNYYLLMLYLVSIPSFSATVENSSYSQCVAYDNANNKWLAQHPYQKMALNNALDLCKKASLHPRTCHASINDCEGFYMGMSIKPRWICTALDAQATPWSSNFHSKREAAALAAQAFCKENSLVAETCYINLITCKNSNHWDSL